MTKGERIFEDSYRDCLGFVRAWGEERNPDGSIVCFNRLSYKETETISTRTLNAIEVALKSKIRLYRYMDEKMPSTDSKNRLLACEMVETIIGKHRTRIANEK